MRASRLCWFVLAAVLCVVVQHTTAQGHSKQHPLRQQQQNLERNDEQQWVPVDVNLREVKAEECDPTNQDEAKVQINAMEEALHPLLVESQEASWLENIDHTDDHAAAANAAYSAYSLAYAEWWGKVINCYDYDSFDDQVLRRRFALQATPGTTVLSEEDQGTLNTALSKMNALALKKICPYNKKDSCSNDEKKSMDDLEGILAEERDPEALVYYWEEWRNTAGRPAREDYIDYVHLMNKAATMEGNGFTDASEMWLQPYTTDNYTTVDFKSDVADLWENMEELYVKLHAYVRYRLRMAGPYEESFAADSPIPAHLLGNMWGQSWENIYDLVKPYDVELLDISDALEQNVNETQMFKYAENFFVETGLFSMTQKFWDNSMTTQPTDAIAVCHASAWDFLSYNTNDQVGPQTDGDFRIKMCTNLNQEDFIVIHHEMGHTQYQMSYSQEKNSVVPPPLIFRDGANPGFHEAIGDTIALSVSTPNHLKGLYEDITGETYNITGDADKRNINQLMKIALAKVAFIPYAYILDQFRWQVFNAEIPVNDMNYHWWDMRVKVQGLKPPVLRERDEDFDPGCKFHVSNGIPYIRYFVAHILQFQFHERLCEVAGIGGDVFECDIYNHDDAGTALKALLSQGASAPWTDQLRDFMGTEEGRMDSSSIRAYFQPLEDFLDEQIEKHGIMKNWDKEVDKYFVANIPATVPIVVGIVLAVMIVIVVAAYFVGKRRQDKKQANKDPVRAEAGKSNPTFNMEERKSSSSSNDS